MANFHREISPHEFLASMDGENLTHAVKRCQAKSCYGTDNVNIRYFCTSLLFTASYVSNYRYVSQTLNYTHKSHNALDLENVRVRVILTELYEVEVNKR